MLYLLLFGGVWVFFLCFLLVLLLSLIFFWIDLFPLSVPATPWADGGRNKPPEAGKRDPERCCQYFYQPNGEQVCRKLLGALCVFSLPWRAVPAPAPVSISLAVSEFVVQLETRLFWVGDVAICILHWAKVFKTYYYLLSIWYLSF